MTQSPQDAGFHRSLGLFDAVMLVAGSMVGSGIFIVSADISRDVGSAGWLLFIWGLAGVLTLIGALSYAELAGMMPHAGGQYVFLRQAYGALPAFLYGWTCFLVIQTGFIAAVSVAFAKFLGVLVPWLGTDNILWRSQPLDWKLAAPVPWMAEPLTFFQRKDFTLSAGQLVAVCVIFLLTLINLRGVHHGKWVQNIFTSAKILAMIALIVLGLSVARDPEAIQLNLEDPWGGLLKGNAYAESFKIAPIPILAAFLVISGAMVGALFSLDAWNNVTFIAAEIKEPRRNLPRSLFLGVGMVVVLYLLANVTYLSSLPLHGVDKGATAFERGIDHAKDDRVGTAVLEQVSPGIGVPFMAIAIMISTFGCVNGIVLMGARLYYAMAGDRLFFQSVGKLSANGVPAAGLILQMLWSIVLVFSGSYNELLDYVVFGALLFYVLTVAALFKLRRSMPDAERPYRVIGYPIVPGLYLIVCLAIMLALLVVKPVYSWPSFLIILSGVPIYLLWRLRAT